MAIMVMIGQQFCPYLQRTQGDKFSGCARIFTGNNICFAQGLARTRAKIAQIANGCGYKFQHNFTLFPCLDNFVRDACVRLSFFI